MPKRKIRRKAASKRKRTAVNVSYRFNPRFQLAGELQALLAKAAPRSFPELARLFKKIGRVQLAVVTGMFLHLETARADLLVVGDGINLKKLNEFIKDLEADLGREIRYVTLGRDEFLYRYRMFDRFLRDILESPHQKVINRLRLR